MKNIPIFFFNHIFLSHPSILLSHPFIFLSHPSILLTYPSIFLFHPFTLLPHPSILLSHPPSFFHLCILPFQPLPFPSTNLSFISKYFPHQLLPSASTLPSRPPEFLQFSNPSEWQPRGLEAGLQLQLNPGSSGQFL